MKKLCTFLVLWALTIAGFGQVTKTFHDFTVNTIDGDTFNLSRYYGKKVLVVNTASACAYTYEYTPLQQLYNSYKKYNFEIVGFPCNDFGSQEQGSDSVIDAFCTGTYGVTFQMMSKIAIVSHDTAPVYKWLQRKSLNGVADKGVTWNFNKFLIDEAGHWVKYYDSPVSPLDTGITNWIKSPSVIPPRKFITTDHDIPDPVEMAYLPPVVPLSGERDSRGYDITAIPDVAIETEMIKIRSSNPASFSFNCSVLQVFNRLTIRLYSVDGRLISTVYEGTANENQLIDYPVSSLSNGIYLLNVTGDGKQKTIRYAVAR